MLKNVCLTCLSAQDAPVLVELNGEKPFLNKCPEFAEQLVGVTQTATVLETDLPEGILLYAVKLADVTIGVVGLVHNAELRETELVYCVLRRYKGCGYTKEAVNGLTDWALHEGGYDYLILNVDATDLSAGRLAEKCGFVLYEKRFPMYSVMPGIAGEYYAHYRKY